MVEQFQETLGSCIAGGLLLEAVAPQTAILYVVSLCVFLEWKRETRQGEVETVAELDDCLARWIQQNYEAWRDGKQTEGRQLCVLARCGLLLLRPRLGVMRRASGKMLEAWKRVSPSVHYTPLPRILFCLCVSELLAEGQDQEALITWLAYHCLLRPGEA